MFLSNLAVRRPVLTTMLVMVFVVLGFYSYTRIKVDLFPEVEFPIVTVTTIYPGAGPAEVEIQVTEVLEDEVIAIGNVRTVNSISQENVSVILVEFEIGTEVDIAAIEVKDKIDAIRFELPTDAEPPSVVKFDIAATPVMDLAIYGDAPLEALFEIADTTVKDAMSRVGGVSSVSVVGGKEREIHVDVDNRKLKAYGLSIGDVIQSIAMANLSVPAGSISQGAKEYSIRLIGEFESLDELRDVRIATRQGPPVLLVDIGRIYDGFKEQRELARYEGQASVGVTVQKRSDANVIETADGLLVAVERLRAELPGDVRIDIVMDGSTFIRSSVRDVLISIVFGILLTSGILYVFLHDVRSTFIAAIAMPTSIIATFLLIDSAGFTLNIISLLALGISLGTLVSNAIVVLESISRHINAGEEPHRAAENGTAEIAVAVVASTMTNVMVFTPIAFMAGLVGQFFQQFALTVVFATLFSLLVSFTLTPMLAARLLRPSDGAYRRSPLRPLFRAWDTAYGALEGGYRNALAWSLRHRVAVTSLTALLFVGGIFIFRFVGNEFLPTFDQGIVRLGVEMPAGTSLEQTNRTLMRVESFMRELPETQATYTTLGKSTNGTEEGVEFGQVTVTLKEDRARKGGAILADIRPRLLAEIPDALLSFDLSQGQGRGGQADITIEVTGNDLTVLASIAGQVKGIVAAAPGELRRRSGLHLSRRRRRV